MKNIFLISIISINIYAVQADSLKTIIVNDLSSGRNYNINICSPHHNKYNKTGNITNECKFYINKVKDVSKELKSDMERLEKRDFLNDQEINQLKEKTRKLQTTVKTLESFNILMQEDVEELNNQVDILIDQLKKFRKELEKLKSEKSLAVGDLYHLIRNDHDTYHYFDAEFTYEILEVNDNTYNFFLGSSLLSTNSKVKYSVMQDTWDQKESINYKNIFVTALIGVKLNLGDFYSKVALKHAFLKFNKYDNENFEESFINTSKNPTLLSVSIGIPISIVSKKLFFEYGYEYIWKFPIKNVTFNPYGTSKVTTRDYQENTFWRLRWYWGK